MGGNMKKEISINGGLRAKKRDLLLTLYSTPLARILMDKKIKYLDVEYTSDQFILRPGTQRSIVIERKRENRPLSLINVGRFIPTDLKLILRSEKKQRRVKIVLKNITTNKELLFYNNGINYTEVDNINLDIPESEKIKVGCYVSCFRNKNGFNYRFAIRHRILEEIAVKKEKVVIARNKKGEFILKRDKRGRTFNLYKDKKGHALSYMQISPSLVTKKEKRLFESGRRCVSSRAYLSRKEFNLDISQFFMTKTERELAYALLKRNINVRIPEMRKREADIVLKDSGIQIELTNLKPREKENTKNSPHTEGVHINARICEGYLRVSKGLVPSYFVVFNKSWLNYKWINDLILIAEPQVNCITTDFEFGWEKHVADKIKSILDRKGVLK